MKINYDNKNQTFKSGLTYKLFKDIKNVNIKKSESDFAKLGVDANFLENKLICWSSVSINNILNDISSKYRLPLDFLPPAIRVYKESSIIYKSSQGNDGFCLVEKEPVLKGELPFAANSIFFNDWNKNILIHNLFSTIYRLQNYNSTGHFLHTFLHEWFHCIYQNLFFKQHGYEGNDPALREKYYRPDASGISSLKYNDKMWDVYFYHKKEVEDKISSYAVETECSSAEIFAELMAKITAMSLDKNLNVTKNPLDNMPKDLPKSVTDMVEELLNI